jgi:thymus-specific serine protease
MRIISLFVFFAIVFGASASSVLRYFNVPVGHYNPLIRRFFDLRYFANDEHYTAGGPIYIYIGGTSEVYEELLESGTMYEIAKETGGYLFALEHRYFGTSRPNPDTSTGNLAFLTIHQVVADIGEFISFIRQHYDGAENSKVILWGRGYGGSLAVWTRHKFKHLVDGVWASSSPLNAILESLDVLRNTANTIEQIGGSQCRLVLDQAFRAMDDAVRLRDTSYLEKRFKLCSPIDIDNEDDVSRFFFGVSTDIAYKFLLVANVPQIEAKCAMMTGNSENPIDAFARWFVDDFNRNRDCLNYNNEAILQTYKNVSWDSESTSTGRRQGFWLQCTQLGQFASSGDGEGHPFGSRFNFEFFRRWCAQVFDEALFLQSGFMEEGIARNNVFYGGLDPKVRNVFLTHGDIDPRRSLGPSEDLNEYSPVEIIPSKDEGC